MKKCRCNSNPTGLTAVVVGGVVGYGTLSPNSMFVNVSAWSTVWDSVVGSIDWYRNPQSSSLQTRRDHPLVCFGAVAVTLYYVFYMFSSVSEYPKSRLDSSLDGGRESWPRASIWMDWIDVQVMVLLFSLLLPLFFVLIHASTRLRNFRAKVRGDWDGN